MITPVTSSSASALRRGLTFTAGCQRPVVKVHRERKRGIFRQIKAQNRRNIGNISRFCNAELAEKTRFRRGLTFTAGC